jgi:hypothetical protein
MASLAWLAANQINRGCYDTTMALSAACLACAGTIKTNTHNDNGAPGRAVLQSIDSVTMCGTVPLQGHMQQTNHASLQLETSTRHSNLYACRMFSCTTPKHKGILRGSVHPRQQTIMLT